LGCTVGTPLNGNLLPARGAAFLAGVTTPIRHRPRRGAAASLAVAALVGLLFSVWHSPGRNAGEGRSGLVSATPSASASIARGGSSPESSERDGTSLWIDLVAGDEIATATLDDTPEARAFAATLPITVEMEDRFGQAKTGLLPRPVPLADAGRSRSYAAGDLSHWSPSGRIAVVYDTLGRSVPPPGLVRLGTVQTGLRAIASAGDDFTMTIRRCR
jgi:hypothetical protein